MADRTDIIGKQCGNYLVLSLHSDNRYQNKRKYLCKCTCGSVVPVSYSQLMYSDPIACRNCKGLVSSALLREDLTNQTFGLLFVASYAGSDKRGPLWNCECKCGATPIITARGLKNGTQSCGHLVSEKTRESLITHGMTNTPIYRVYRAMIARCHNPNVKSYSAYGGRGISVCDRWRYSFEAFYSDMGDRPNGMSLDRIDVNGNYEPTNVRWATRQVQANNRRPRQRAKLVEFQGEWKTMKDWALSRGLKPDILRIRLYNGWRMEEALNTPSIPGVKTIRNRQTAPEKPQRIKKTKATTSLIDKRGNLIGKRRGHFTHGMSGTSVYNIYLAMIQRCCNPNFSSYHNYGGRGIQVCQEWRESFEAFYAHVGPRPSLKHSLDRIDNDGNYEPQNVRWATRAEQALNRRPRTAPLIELNGEQHTVLEWSKIKDLPRHIIDSRLQNGWDVDSAINTPRLRKRKILIQP